MASLVYAFVAHLLLFGALRKRGVEIPLLLLGSLLFFLQFEYLRGRHANRSRKLDFLARSALVAPFVGLVFLLAAFVIWPDRA